MDSKKTAETLAGHFFEPVAQILQNFRIYYSNQIATSQVHLTEIVEMPVLENCMFKNAILLFLRCMVCPLHSILLW